MADPSQAELRGRPEEDISGLPRITVTPQRPPDDIQPGSDRARQMTHQPAYSPALSANPTLNDLMNQVPNQGQQVDPLTGAVINPSPSAQGKFGSIMDAIGIGLRNWFETPGRAYQEGLTPEEEADWGAGTAFGMLGTNAPAAMTGAIPRGSLGIMGGPMSATADLNMLNRAIQMERLGFTPGQIHNATGGWFRHPHPQANNWMYEISDKNSRMARPPPTEGDEFSGRLGDILDHPDLFAAYPALKDLVGVYINPGLADAHKYGYHGAIASEITPPGGKTTRGMVLVEEPPELVAKQRQAGRIVPTTRSTAIHEASHLVQDLEGFPQGSTGADINYNRQVGELLANLAMRRKHLSKEQVKYMPAVKNLEGVYTIPEQVVKNVRQEPWNQRNIPRLIRTKTGDLDLNVMREYIRQKLEFMKRPGGQLEPYTLIPPAPSP